MKNETLQGATNFKVVCTWCGALIRHSHIKDSRGMCQNCYARLLNEHFRPLRANLPARRSER
ncbi:MAG TPA: hypothetical protein VN228_11200 [Pyrinomonadaceae bacterium]|nr:hypothetical protein [Pyrinomonadaceae bacterium]